MFRSKHTGKLDEFQCAILQTTLISNCWFSLFYCISRFKALFMLAVVFSLIDRNVLRTVICLLRLFIGVSKVSTFFASAV